MKKKHVVVMINGRLVRSKLLWWQFLIFYLIKAHVEMTYLQVEISNRVGIRQCKGEFIVLLWIIWRKLPEVLPKNEIRRSFGIGFFQKKKMIS